MLRFAFGAALLATAAFAGDFKATCPVSGKKATEESKVEKDGKTVYFCCENCPKSYEANEKKFAAQTNYQLFETHQIVQKACPFTGKDLNPETKTKVGKGGVEVAFCCENCQKKVKSAKPAEQVNLVFKDIKKGFETAKKKDADKKDS